ncbi:hypothetical protein GCM10020216_023220 [Nonomuraea helvata]
MAGTLLLLRRHGAVAARVVGQILVQYLATQLAFHGRGNKRGELPLPTRRRIASAVPSAKERLTRVEGASPMLYEVSDMVPGLSKE